MQQTTRPVAIAGAGPIGLTTALLLATYGIHSVIMERRATPSCGQSRAITMQRDVLALLDRLGILDDIVTNGASWSLGRTYFGDTEILQLRFPATGEALYPAFINYPQFRVEELLYAAVQDTGMVDIRHERTVREFVQDETSVVIMADTPNGPECCEASYLVAADGIGSVIRKQLEIPYQGWDTRGRFRVCDFRANLTFACERRLWFCPSFYPDGIVLMHSFGPNQWRIDWQIDPDTDHNELHQDELLRQIADVIGNHPVEVLRTNTYTFQQRRADRFAEGRVFLAGDSAHVVSPFGARGMNSGMEDAENLAWKLGYVLTGQASPELLNTYDTERCGAAEHHVEITGATMNFMTPATEQGRAHRDAVLAAAAKDPTRVSEVDSGKLYEPFPYSTSVLTELIGSDRNPTFDDPVAPGQLAPDGSCTADGAPTTLRALTGGVLSLLAVPAPESNPETLTARLAATAQEFPELHRFVLTPKPTTDDRVVSLADTSGALTKTYTGPTDRLFLIRPDCYLGVRADLRPEDWDWTPAVRQAMATVLSKPR